MGVVEQRPKFLVRLFLGLLMGRRLNHVFKVIVVDQGREFGHHYIHLLLRVEIHAIWIVASSVFMHHWALRKIRRNEFSESLEVVLVAATDVENLWSIRVEMRGFLVIE